MSSYEASVQPRGGERLELGQQFRQAKVARSVRSQDVVGVEALRRPDHRADRLLEDDTVAYGLRYFRRDRYEKISALILMNGISGRVCKHPEHPNPGVTARLGRPGVTLHSLVVGVGTGVMA
jgi:hypothetical protein